MHNCPLTLSVPYSIVQRLLKKEKHIVVPQIWLLYQGSVSNLSLSSDCQQIVSGDGTLI